MKSARGQMMQVKVPVSCRQGNFEFVLTVGAAGKVLRRSVEPTAYIGRSDSYDGFPRSTLLGLSFYLRIVSPGLLQRDTEI